MPPARTILLAALALFFMSLVVGIGHASPRLPVMHPDLRAERIVISKSERNLLLYSGGEEIRRYSVSLGGEPIGPKRCRGDQRTPEGSYRIVSKNPNSKYHLSLGISYPNSADLAEAASRGCQPGGDIMIHGLQNGLGFLGGLHRLTDWTRGCIAVSNREIAEIWSLVEVGTPVEIRP